MKVSLKYSNISSEGKKKKEKEILKIAVHLGSLCLFDTLNFPGLTRNLATQERNTMFFVRWQNLPRCVLALPIPTRGKSQRSLRKLAKTILTYNRLLLPVNYRYWIRPPVAFYNFDPSVSSISIQYLCAKILENRNIRWKISSWIHILTRY